MSNDPSSSPKSARHTLAFTAVGIGFCLLLLWLVYWTAGRLCVKWAYQGTFPIPAVNELITGQEEHGVELYYEFLAHVCRVISLVLLLTIPIPVVLNLAGRFRLRLARPLIMMLLYGVLIEVFIRSVMFTDAFKIGPLQNPDYFASPFHDDLWWKMRINWRGLGIAPNPARIHPRLGWSQTDVTESSPFGLEPESVERMGRGEAGQILFYGDSFVKGAAEDPANYIPVRMERNLPDSTVVDLGVSGYGVDQVYLMYRETIDHFERPLVIFSLMVTDLDRSLLTCRDGLKPFFRVQDEKLVLKGVPVPTSGEAVRKATELEPGSYFVRMLKVFFTNVFTDSEEYHPREQEIRKVAGAVLESFKLDCEQRELPYLVVVFYPRWFAEKISWREEFLKEQIRELEMPLFDTKPALHAYARAKGISVYDLYDGEGHHVDLGNQVVADALAAHLRKTNRIPLSNGRK